MHASCCEFTAVGLIAATVKPNPSGSVVRLPSEERGGSNRRLRSMGEDVDGSSSSMLAPSSGEGEGGAADDDAVAPLPVAVEDDAADDDAAAPLPLPGWA